MSGAPTPAARAFHRPVIHGDPLSCTLPEVQLQGDERKDVRRGLHLLAASFLYAGKGPPVVRAHEQIGPQLIPHPQVHGGILVQDERVAKILDGISIVDSVGRHLGDQVRGAGLQPQKGAVLDAPWGPREISSGIWRDPPMRTRVKACP